MTDSLAEYVRGKQLYSSIAGGFFGGGSMPSLTVGALLLRLRRLQLLTEQLPNSQRAQLEQITEQHDEVQKEWTMHYENKMVEEATSRLNLIGKFLNECKENLRNCDGIYLPEVLRRTIVQELLHEMKHMKVVSAEIDTKLEMIDTQLQKLVKSADFLWSEILQPAYPADEFWWLYHRPGKVK